MLHKTPNKITEEFIKPLIIDAYQDPLDLNLVSNESKKNDYRRLFFDFLSMLRNGYIRAAEPDEQGVWHVNKWVKQGILLGMRIGQMTALDTGVASNQPFIDKDTILTRPLSLADKVRLVPGGSSIRDGAYVASGVVVMPPAFINVGAYVDEGTMVDSHALIGSCAQIGKRVHVSACAQIGGVLEPAHAHPVIVEQDAFIGGNCGLYEGVHVEKNAVLAAGVVLTAATKVYDLVHEKIYTSSSHAVLKIPAGAVVLPGTRALMGDFAKQHGLSVSAAIIMKYRDEKTNAKTALESVLRA